MTRRGSQIRTTRSPPQQMGAIFSTIRGDDEVVFIVIMKIAIRRWNLWRPSPLGPQEQLTKASLSPVMSELCLEQIKYAKARVKTKTKKSPVSGPL
jgi:hypothetical protein